MTVNPTRHGYFRWLVLALSYLLVVLFGFALQSAVPLFPLIGGDINLSHTAEAGVMAAFGFPGLVIPLVSANLAARINRKTLVLAGLVTMTAGLLLFATATALPILWVARLIAGAGGMILVTFAPSFINDVFPKSSIGKVIGFFNTGVPLGFVLATTLCGPVATHFGWRMTTAAIGIVGLALAATFWMLFPAATVAPEAAPAKGERKMPMIPAVFLMVAINMLVSGVTGPFGTFAPAYFKSAGVHAGTVSMIMAAMMAVTTLIGPFIGFVVDSVGRYRRFLVAAAVLFALAFGLLVLPGVPAVVGPLLLGIGSAVVPVAMFPLLTAIVSSRQMAGGLALLITGSNVGNSLGLTLIGTALDGAAGFRTIFLSLALLAMLLPLLAAAIPHPRSPAPEGA